MAAFTPFKNKIFGLHCYLMKLRKFLTLLWEFFYPHVTFPRLSIATQGHIWVILQRNDKWGGCSVLKHDICIINNLNLNGKNQPIFKLGLKK